MTRQRRARIPSAPSSATAIPPARSTATPSANRPGPVVRIGSLPVVLESPLPAPFAGLGRLPGGRSRRPARVALSLVLASAADWPMGLQRNRGRFYKGMTSHATEMDFAGRTLRIRVRAPVTPRVSYRVMRDIFCGLGGMSGEVLLHAATVIHRGAALVFGAESGGGKSTIAALLAPEVEVINDEILWVRWTRAAGWVAVNQGFWNVPASPAPDAIPIRTVYLLQKAPRCSVSTVRAGVGFPQLLTAPFGGQDPLLPARALQTARFLEAVPVRRLRFSRDAAELRRLLLSTRSE